MHSPRTSQVSSDKDHARTHSGIIRSSYQGRSLTNISDGYLEHNQNQSESGLLGSQDDPSFKELSLYEKKCFLINREINAMGMGKYQWYIWSLCGLGYFLDLLWAQAFGLIATPLQRELGFSSM